MRPTRENLLSEAMQLPEEDRVLLINQLLETVHTPDDPEVEGAWQEEIARRIAEVESGRVKPLPWSEARRQIVGDAGGPAAN